MNLPAAVPEIPVADLARSLDYYAHVLGFTVDWGGEAGSTIAGISRGHCRLFLTDPTHRQRYGNTGPVLTWLNLQSKAQVDALFAQWQAAHALIVSEPQDQPWQLREFVIADPDRNLLRVFFDFGTAA